MMGLAVSAVRDMASDEQIAAWQQYLERVKGGESMVLIEDPIQTCKELERTRKQRWNEVHDVASSAFKEQIRREFRIGEVVTFEHGLNTITARVVAYPEFDFDTKLRLINKNTGTAWEREPWELKHT